MAEVFGNSAGGNTLLPTQELRTYTANLDETSIVLNTMDGGLVRQEIDSGPSSATILLTLLDKIIRNNLDSMSSDWWLFSAQPTVGIWPTEFFPRMEEYIDGPYSEQAAARQT
ncbi:hypothetical protein MMC30_004971 [Trapelia coarctata]|nr:hypothetical protein [Trapelia coarctata]